MNAIFLTLLFVQFVSSTANNNNNNNRNRLWQLPAKSTAVVTGGTKGIGHAIVSELCLSFGCKILTCARNEKELNECIKEWQEKGCDVRGCVADISTTEGRSSLMDAVKDLINDDDCANPGKLDILIKPGVLVTSFDIELFH